MLSVFFHKLLRPSSDAVSNTFSLLGRIKRHTLPYPEILACLIEICRKKLIWTPYNCQKTTYYLVRHMSGTASELGLKALRKTRTFVVNRGFFQILVEVTCRFLLACARLSVGGGVSGDERKSGRAKNGWKNGLFSTQPPRLFCASLFS